MTTSELVVEQESRTRIRELDHRASDGIDIRLLWNAETKDILVSVAERDGMDFEFQVAATDARPPMGKRWGITQKSAMTNHPS
jgi:hypothetical protein